MRAPPHSPSLLESNGGSSLLTAVQWIERVLLGEVAVILAVIAVAVVGLLFLTGRLPWGQAARVVLGCAIVFGAPAITAGLIGSMGQNIASPTSMAHQSYAPQRADLPAVEATSGASLRRD